MTMSTPAFSTTAPVRGLAPAARDPGALRCTRRRPMAMVATAASPATDATSGAKLSLRARDLISYIRAHKSIFDPGEGFGSQVITLCRKNDTGRFFIPADELETNRALLPGAQVAEHILNQKAALIDAAAAAVFASQKDAGENPLVAEVVRHDLMYILRVVSYAIAAGSPNFVHENNLGMMKSLHAEIGLSSPAVVAGLKKLSDSIAAEAEMPDAKATTLRCFQIVTEFMSV